jgi:hypothetical protein
LYHKLQAVYKCLCQEFLSLPRSGSPAFLKLLLRKWRFLPIQCGDISWPAIIAHVSD